MRCVEHQTVAVSLGIQNFDLSGLIVIECDLQTRYVSQFRRQQQTNFKRTVGRAQVFRLGGKRAL